MNSLAMATVAMLLATQAPGAVDIRDVAPEQHPIVSVVLRVLDQRGRAVPGLGRADFDIAEDGVSVPEFEVRPSFREGGSLAVVLLVDTSYSMLGAPLDGAKAATKAFLDRLGPDDRVALITFGRPPVEQAGFGPPSAITGVDTLQAAGYTGLYDALNLGVVKLSAQSARARAVVALTDGGDDGSSLSFEQVHEVARSAGLPIHSVGFESPEFRAEPMEELAAVSRGTYRQTADPDQLATLYRQIADELVAEYRITYRSAAAPGRHTLTVVAQHSSTRLSGERTYEVVGLSPTTVTLSEGPEDRPGRDSVRVLPLVIACALAVLSIIGVTAARARRDRARPVAPVRLADPPSTVRNGMVLEGQGVVIPLHDGVVLVGRDPAAHVIVDDPTVSRHHARLQVRPEGLWVEDLGSSNGTLVNGVRVETTLMRFGDAIDIGDLHLVLRLDQS